MDAVQRMLEQVEPLGKPPLHLWDPPLSGDIAIRIASDGSWFHEGTFMERHKLVQLFASILRFEPDYGFVLVTPVEKWRIEVEDAPFIATALAVDAEGQGQQLRFASNLGEQVTAGATHPIVLRDAKPYVQIREGLLAKMSRPVYYQLAELAVEHGGSHGVWSDGEFFAIA